MAWVVGGGAVLILVVFAAGYRKVAAGLLAIALVAGGLLYMHNRQEEHDAVTRIPSSELVLENVTLKPYVGSYKIAGRIKNNSAKFSVKQIDLAVTVQDCIGGAAAKQCTTIGESKEILLLNIPPGEARNFEESVRFGSNQKLKGRLEWNYSISQIRAK
jgi:hypothetical protein